MKIYTVLIFVTAVACTPKLPANFKYCHLWGSDPKCMPEAINIAIKELKDGYPPLKINSLDPLQIVRLQIVQGDGPVKVDLDLKDVNIEGISNGSINEVEVKPDGGINRVMIKAFFPKLLVKAEYKVHGKVLLLPITGDGPGTMEMDDVDIDAELDIKNVTQNGVPHLLGETFFIEMKPKKLVFDLKNLFSGNEAMGNTMNKVLNDNSMELLKEMKEPIKIALSEAFLDTTNKVFNAATLEELNRPS